jgi:hypothetical protein
MKNWKSTFTYKSKRYVEQPVGDDENVVRFYPNQLGILEQLAELSDPITEAINKLMGAEGRNYQTETKSYVEGDMQVEETVIGSTDRESMRARVEERGEGIKSLVAALGNGRNLRLFGLAWMDSMKEEFGRKRGGHSPEMVEEFLFGDGEDYEGLEVPQMIQIMSGWLRANAKVFGDLGERLVGFVKAQMEQRLRDESTSDEGAETTNGEGSKIPSSQPSDSDSPLATSKSST